MKESISDYYYTKLEVLKKRVKLHKTTVFEAQFLDDRWDAMEKYKENMRLSDKQKDVLRDICRKFDV